MTFNRKQIADIAERVAWTFGQAFVAALLASGAFDLTGVVDMSIYQKAAFAGIAAVLSLVKSAAAAWISTSGSASTLPAELEPAAAALDGTELSVAERSAVRAIRAAD